MSPLGKMKVLTGGGGGGEVSSTDLLSDIINERLETLETYFTIILFVVVIIAIEMRFFEQSMLINLKLM